MAFQVCQFVVSVNLRIVGYGDGGPVSCSRGLQWIAVDCHRPAVVRYDLSEHMLVCGVRSLKRAYMWRLELWKRRGRSLLRVNPGPYFRIVSDKAASGVSAYREHVDSLLLRKGCSCDRPFVSMRSLERCQTLTFYSSSAHLRNISCDTLRSHEALLDWYSSHILICIPRVNIMISWEL